MIGVDEAQFFDDLYDFCCDVADKDGKIIIVAGLDGDYLRSHSDLSLSFSVYMTILHSHNFLHLSCWVT